MWAVHEFEMAERTPPHNHPQAVVLFPGGEGDDGGGKRAPPECKPCWPDAELAHELQPDEGSSSQAQSSVARVEMITC